MSDGGIQYKLQIQLHEIQPEDSHLVLHASRVWDQVTHPWLDLANVKLTSLIPLDVTESTRSSLENMPTSLSVPPAKTIYDYNSSAYLKLKVQSGSSSKLNLRRPSKTGEDMSIYCISVFTGDRKYAGTNADVTLTITGKTEFKHCTFFTLNLLSRLCNGKILYNSEFTLSEGKDELTFDI